MSVIWKVPLYEELEELKEGKEWNSKGGGRDICIGQSIIFASVPSHSRNAPVI